MCDLDRWIENVRKPDAEGGSQLMPERDLKHLCEYVSYLLMEESTVQPVAAPVTICGDIHGQPPPSASSCQGAVSVHPLRLLN